MTVKGKKVKLSIWVRATDSPCALLTADWVCRIRLARSVSEPSRHRIIEGHRV